MAVSPDNATLLEQLQHETFMHLLTVIIFMAIVGIVGIIGNILTILFYASKPKRCPSTIQITCLATVDLMVCCMILPNIMEMVVNVKYYHGILCKLTHFFGLWTIACSCFILWLIALDRHWKICQPFAKQMTVRSTKHAIIAIVIVSFFISVRNFVNFNDTEVSVDYNTNKTVTGRVCTTRDDAGYKVSVTVFYGVDFIFVMVCLSTIIVTYSRIIFTLFKLKRNKRQTSAVKYNDSSLGRNISFNENSDTSLETYNSKSPPSSLERKVSGLSDLNSYASSSALTHQQAVATISDAPILQRNSLRRNVFKMNDRKRKRRHKIAARSASERNLTFMMLTVSLLFVLCFFPFFVIKIIMRLVLKSGVELELTVGIQFGLKLVYLNSVFNPIVYCFFNPQFRRYVKCLMLKCIICKNK